MATVWGRAEVIIDVNGNNVVRRVRQIAREAGEAGGKDAGDSFSKSFTRTIGKSDAFKGFTAKTNRLGRAIQSLSNDWRGLSHNTRQWALIIGGVAAALPEIVALTSAAGVGVLALGGAFTAAGIGIGVAVSTLLRFTGDLEDVPEAVRPARAAFDRMKDSLSDLNGELTTRVFKDTEKSWDALAGAAKRLEGPLGKFADVINGLIKSFADHFNPETEQGQENLNKLGRVIEKMAPIFDRLVRAAGVLGGALLTAFDNPAMQNAISGLVGWINDLATGFDNFVNSPGYTEWVNNGVSVFEHMGGLLESLGISLSGLFDKETTDNLNTFMDSLGKFLEGPGKSLIDFIDELDIPNVLINAINNFADALKPMVDELTKFVDANPDAVKKGLEAIATGLLAIAAVKITSLIVTPLSGFFGLLTGKNISKIDALALAVGGLAISWEAASREVEEGDWVGTLMASLQNAFGGALTGGGIGALIGSIVPVIGTAVGAAFGAVIGAIVAEISRLWQNGSIQEAWNGITEFFNMDGGTLMTAIENFDKSFLIPFYEGIGDSINTFATETLPAWWQGITEWFSDLSLPGGEGNNPWADTAFEWGQTLRTFFTETLPNWWTNITTWFQGLFLPSNNPWVANLSTWAATIMTFFTVTLPTWWSNITAWFGNLKLFGNPLSSLMSSWAASIWNFVTQTLPSWWQAIVNFFSGKSISSLVAGATRVSGGGGGGGGMAAGGVLYGPRRILAGEDGPEAIVPLRRNLGRVDPSVRALSAIAQGITPLAGGGVVTPGRAPVAITNNIFEAGNPERTALLVANRIAERVAG